MHLQKISEKMTTDAAKLTLYYNGLNDFFTIHGQTQHNIILQHADEWIKANPDSVSAHLVKPMGLAAMDNSLIGYGYANTVKSEVWAINHVGIQKQKQYFMGHQALAKVDPS